MSALWHARDLACQPFLPPECLTPGVACRILRAVSGVKAIRKAHGLSQQQLASMAGIGMRTLQSIESGATSPTVRTLQRLADALGVQVAELLLEEGAA